MIVAAAVSTILFAVAGAAPADPASTPSAKPATQGNTVSEAVVTAKAKDDPMKLVCRNEVPVGSRLPVKRCMTKGEADMRKFDDRQMLERAQGDTYHW